MSILHFEVIFTFRKQISAAKTNDRAFRHQYATDWLKRRDKKSPTVRLFAQVVKTRLIVTRPAKAIERYILHRNRIVSQSQRVYTHRMTTNGETYETNRCWTKRRSGEITRAKAKNSGRAVRPVLGDSDRENFEFFMFSCFYRLCVRYQPFSRYHSVCMCAAAAAVSQPDRRTRTEKLDEKSEKWKFTTQNCNSF